MNTIWFPICRPGSIRTALVVQLLAVALSSLASAASADSWTGSIRCEIQVTAPGYSHQETQTWTLTGAAPTTQGAYLNYPANWSVSGQGWHDRSGQTARRIAVWASAVPGSNSPLRGTIAFFRPNTNQLSVLLSHGQLSSSDGYRGTDQYVNADGFVRPAARLVVRLLEFRFERIEALPTDTTITGSRTTEFIGAIAPLHPGDAKVMVTLTWALGKGTPPPMPPPTLPTPPPPPESPGAPNPSSPVAPSAVISPPKNSSRPSAGPAAVTPSPAKLLTVSPNSVEQGTSLSAPITLTGQNTRWQEGQTAVDFGPGISIQGRVGVNSSTSATVQVNVAYAASLGPRAVTVVTGSEVVTLPNVFTVIARQQPVIAQINPNRVLAGSQNVSVTLTGRGTNWNQATTKLMLMNSPGITLAGPENVASPSSMTVRLNIDATAAPGPREIRVVNTGSVAASDTISVPDGLTVTVPNPLENASVVPFVAGILIPQLPITVVSPNGGENFLAGGINYPVSWKHTLGPTQKFDIDLSTDRGVTWNVLRSAFSPRTLSQGVVGEYLPLIDAASTNALVRVRATGQTSPSDVSDNPFTLTAPSVRVIKPAAGEKWKIGSKPSPQILWAHNMGSEANFWIALSRDGGQTWEIINGWGLNSSGDWFEVSGPPTTQAIVQVRTSTNPSIVAESARFTIGF